eukprot:12889675-Prorocentrum_lima.AAC.1
MELRPLIQDVFPVLGVHVLPVILIMQQSQVVLLSSLRLPHMTTLPQSGPSPGGSALPAAY